MKCKFRKMTLDDLYEVYEIECELFSDPWPQKSFKRDLKNNRISRAFVLEKKNRIIGYTVCWLYVDELHIGNFAITKKFQGQGYGNYMLKKLLENFQDLELAILEVRAKNISAINLYHKYGFKKIYRRKKYYADKQDAIVMLKYF